MNTEFGKKASKIGAVQGDIPCRYVKALPTGAKVRKSRVIALGEATGHNHVLEAGTVYEDEFGGLFAKLDKPTKLMHQEHGYVVLQPGIVQFGERGVFQVEYDGSEERRVLD